MKKEGEKVARLSIPKSGPPAEKRDRGLYPVFLGVEEEEMLFPPLLSPSSFGGGGDGSALRSVT